MQAARITFDLDVEEEVTPGANFGATTSSNNEAPGPWVSSIDKDETAVMLPPKEQRPVPRIPFCVKLIFGAVNLAAMTLVLYWAICALFSPVRGFFED
ncbi:hypothetical protein CYMTET_28142 [Cymbomonas tetramitiformis]|uniref:Transmembrane protein n=1 Tax=Cymbomonas tetramitiformis TaxID=36881 RepID=A0AAE0FPX2_9CHLO|nr:hypothetical protein CYMTET_28142 [Cymbomonas tetramitiformis]